MNNSQSLPVFTSSIIRATLADAPLLAALGKRTFIESHGHSASQEDIDGYVKEKYTIDAMETELSDAQNVYHIIYYNEEPAGFSKIILNVSHSNIPQANVTKLERIYMLKQFYGLQVGQALLQFNIQLSKEQNQAGMWLFVWTENPRALRFYKKAGFKVIGSHDFALTENHSNPNYQMLLEY